MTDEQPNSTRSRPDGGLHAAIREALADAHPAVKAMGSALLQTPPDSDAPAVGPAPLRRLYAFYTHGAASGLDETQMRADLEWLASHIDGWVARQEQAQQDARSLLGTLRAAYPLPAAVGDRGSPVAVLDQAHALLRVPDHWLHQPWAPRLVGRWTEDLPDAVSEARQWLAERSTSAS